jgi:WD40 repeat protein
MPLAHEKERTRTIRALAYSPSGTTLAVAGDGGAIELLDVPTALTLRARMLGHVSPPLQLDWSSDGTLLRSCAPAMVGAGAVFVWDAAPTTNRSVQLVGRELDNALHGATWASASATLGFEVLGIYAPDSKATDIVTLQRQRTRDDTPGVPPFAAVSYRDGSIRLFPFPCVSMRTHEVSTRWPRAVAHSTDSLSRVVWCGGTRLVSLGERDHAICVWRIERGALSRTSAVVLQARLRGWVKARAWAIYRTRRAEAAQVVQRSERGRAARVKAREMRRKTSGREVPQS